MGSEHRAHTKDDCYDREYLWVMVLLLIVIPNKSASNFEHSQRGNFQDFIANGNPKTNSILQAYMVWLFCSILLHKCIKSQFSLSRTNAASP